MRDSKKNPATKKCTLTQRTGRDCELTHCECGTHDYAELEHACPRGSNDGDSCTPWGDTDAEVRAAERAAGWDPNP